MGWGTDQLGERDLLRWLLRALWESGASTVSMGDTLSFGGDGVDGFIKMSIEVAFQVKVECKGPTW